ARVSAAARSAMAGEQLPAGEGLRGGDRLHLPGHSLSSLPLSPTRVAPPCSGPSPAPAPPLLCPSPPPSTDEHPRRLLEFAAAHGPAAEGQGRGAAYPRRRSGLPPTAERRERA